MVCCPTAFCLSIWGAQALLARGRAKFGMGGPQWFLDSYLLGVPRYYWQAMGRESQEGRFMVYIFPGWEQVPEGLAERKLSWRVLGVLKTPKALHLGDHE